MNSDLFSAYSSLNATPQRKIIKKHRYFKHLLMFNFFLLFCCQTTFATNYYLEEQISLSLQKKINKNEIIWLTSDNPRPSLALFKEAQGVDILGSIIILADLNHHPNWPHIIRPLRYKLARYGWNTLSVQMPIIEENLSPFALENIFTIAKQRIESAINFLKKNYNQNVIIIGRRLSAGLMIRYVIENTEDITGDTEEETPENYPKITAIIGISSFDSNWLPTNQLLRQMPLPYLDIFAQNDALDVLVAAPKRLESAKFSGQVINIDSPLTISPKMQQIIKERTGNLHFRQVKINGAQADFLQHQEDLLKSIRGWLKNYE